MKVTIEFDFESPDDRKEHLRCIKSTDMAIAISSFLHSTRKFIENKVETEKLDSFDTIQLMYDKFAEILDNNGIIIDDLIE